MAIVSLRSQGITVYDTAGWIMRAPVSSGQSGRETPAGIFSVLQKDADHHSNLYDDAWMPHMHRLTWSGIALHGGPLPGYPASHGCVRLPYDFASRLFDLTKLGMRVIISPDDLAPVEIAHPTLPLSKARLAHEMLEVFPVHRGKILPWIQRFQNVSCLDKTAVFPIQIHYGTHRR